MEHLVPVVDAWRAGDEPAVVARVIEFSGFGGRRDGEVTAWAIARPQVRVGTLLGGSGGAILADAATRCTTQVPVAVVEVAVGDEEAVGVGLACGGSATVLVQRTDSIPLSFWECLAGRDTVVLATDLASGASASRRVGGVWDEGSNEPLGALVEVEGAAARLLSGSGARRKTVEIGGRTIVTELHAPASVMVVVGAGELAHALVRQGRLLGWEVEVIDERTDAREQITPRCISLGPVDGVVVLSHALGPSCDALAAAITHRCGYVGALGSRHTQSARAERLRSTHRCTDEQLAVVHGPVGLDLGSRTPEETALAVFAEALAVRSGRTARSLNAGSGPING